jgi:predicted glycoside hydrolase/deacetylase ChbG (UPF0249 family)
LKRLIVNADDFGFTPAVTAGILEAHAAGTVSATSVMVHCPGWDDAVRRSNETPTLDYGLHLNLLVGSPMAKAPSLTGADGNFLPLATIVRRALTGRLRSRDVAAECEAQLAALASAGIRCTHMDSHRHTHALPVIRGAVAAIAAQRKLPLRRPIESHFRAGDFASQLHRGVIASSWRVTSVTAARTRAPDHFVGVSMQGSRGFAEQFIATVDRLAAGSTEMMVHPGHVDETLVAVDSYTHERERELAALTSPQLRDCLRRNDLVIVGFRDI